MILHKVYFYNYQNWKITFHLISLFIGLNLLYAWTDALPNYLLITMPSFSAYLDIPY